jgi:hypothetical protein
MQFQHMLATGDCYEDIVLQLAQRALDAAEKKQGGRLIIGIAGAPGSG